MISCLALAADDDADPAHTVIAFIAGGAGKIDMLSAARIATHVFSAHLQIELLSNALIVRCSDAVMIVIQ